MIRIGPGSFMGLFHDLGQGSAISMLHSGVDNDLVFHPYAILTPPLCIGVSRSSRVRYHNRYHPRVLAR